MQCEMCGSQVPRLYRTIIEGTEINACENCAKFGKVLGPKKTVKEITDEQERVKAYLEKKAAEKQEPNEVVVGNFAEIIRNRRESMGLKQDEIARKLNEKESVIQKMETGHMSPSIELAKKLERFLGVKLVFELKDEKRQGVSTQGGALTIGDIINIRKK